MITLMAHLVAGYPTDDIAMCVAHSLVAGGATILEVQLPFSDPSADGRAIQDACTEVLRRGYRTADALSLIERIKRECSVAVYVMSYGSLVYTPGVGKFCERAARSGAEALIIPDLPFDHDEGLRKGCEDNGMEMIPIVAPSMEESRLKEVANAGFKHIYAALRAGITGQETVIDDKTLKFLRAVKAGGSKVYGGFGIKNGAQSKALARTVDGVVAGSVFVRIVDEHRNDRAQMAHDIEEKAREIVNAL